MLMITATFTLNVDVKLQGHLREISQTSKHGDPAEDTEFQRAQKKLVKYVHTHVCVHTHTHTLI